MLGAGHREVDDADDVKAKAAKNEKRSIALGVVGIVAIAASGYAFSRRGLESTDDAQVDAEMVGLAPRTSGLVVTVAFEDNLQVKAGQVLAEIDPEPARAKLAQAEASLEAAQAAAAAADVDAQLAATNAKASNRAASASMNAASAGAGAARDQIGEARARVAVAETNETNLAQAKTDLARVDKLVASGALSEAQRETCKHRSARRSPR